jgi:hypothetical protein
VRQLSCSSTRSSSGRLAVVRDSGPQAFAMKRRRAWRRSCCLRATAAASGVLDGDLDEFVRRSCCAGRRPQLGRGAAAAWACVRRESNWPGRSRQSAAHAGAVPARHFARSQRRELRCLTSQRTQLDVA